VHFFVNHDVFGGLDRGTNERDNGVSPAVHNHDNEEEEEDFEEIASGALSALDQEYQQILGFSQESSAYSKPRNEHQNQNQNDEDLGIIAAGFDQRKDDLERIREQGGFVVQQQWEEETSGEEESKLSASAAGYGGGGDGGAKKGNPQKAKELQPPKNNSVDTDAVRKAIRTLSVKNKDAPFQQKFAAWQQQNNLQQQQQQREERKNYKEKRQKAPAIDSDADPHPLIPRAPFREFHKPKPTPKSRRATVDLTRSATLAEALVRLSVLSSATNGNGNDNNKNNDNNNDNNNDDDARSLLLIDVVGVDYVECKSASTIRNTFLPLVRWIREYRFYAQGRRGLRLHFRLIGRELRTPWETTGTVTEGNANANGSGGGGVVDLLESSSSSLSSSCARATASCHSGVYHEFLEDLRQSNSQNAQTTANDDYAQSNSNSNSNFYSRRIAPDLAIAFNAGIWGYREWATTIQYMAQLTTLSSSPTTTTTQQQASENNGEECNYRGIPMVITAYTLDECQEDQEVVSEAIAALCTTEEDATKNNININININNNNINNNNNNNKIPTKKQQQQQHRAEILWESEPNPFGSQVKRETKGSTQEYRENASWQAWLLGGSTSDGTSSASCS